MIKAMFIGREDNMNNVYDQTARDRIRALCDLPDTVVTRDNLAENLTLAKEAEFAFSTWGMPAFTTEEIREYFPSLRALFYGAGTVKNFARPFLEAGVRIFSAWGANAVPVVEYTVSQIILANKGFFRIGKATAAPPKVLLFRLELWQNGVLAAAYDSSRTGLGAYDIPADWFAWRKYPQKFRYFDAR